MMLAGRRFAVGVLVMLLLGAMAAPAAAADAGAHMWTRQFGTSQNEEVPGVAVHSTGVYVTGHTWGSLQGVNKGDQDGFVRKYGHDGKLLWTRQFGTPEYDWVYGVAVDAGGVYVAGHTWGSLQGVNKGSADGFVRKYGHDGKLLWTRQFGTNSLEVVRGVAVHSTGVYVAGRTSGSLQGVSKGDDDGFVRKYDLEGKHLWTRQFGTPGEDEVWGVAVDAGGVYAGGDTEGSLKGVSNGGDDGFVRKYGPDGKHLWTRQFGTPQEDYIHGVAVDAGGVYAAGYTWGELRGDNKGETDGFVRRYGSDGKVLWTRQFGTDDGDAVLGVAVHHTGVYVAGYTWGSLQVSSKGSADAFIRKYGTG